MIGFLLRSLLNFLGVFKAKPPLVVLMGAGASVHAGIPVTKGLTEKLKEHSPKVVAFDCCYWAISTRYTEPFNQAYAGSWPCKHHPTAPNFDEVKPFFETLDEVLSKKFSPPNFEHMLAALESLESISNSQQSTKMVDGRKHALAPIVKIDAEYPELSAPRWLNFARDEIIKLIAHLFGQWVSKPGVENGTKDFFEDLSRYYRVNVFTLNYDDLVERTELKLEDGFTTRIDGVSFLRFDERSFEDAVKRGKSLLCHLHGSIRFGFARVVHVPEHIVKYPNPGQAKISLEGFGRGDEMDSGNIVTAEPLISGFNKVSKITYAPIPYGHYYRALSERLKTCSRLVIVGYAFADVHVNKLVEEFLKRHSKKRVVYVDLREPFKAPALHSLLYAAAHPTSINEYTASFAAEGVLPEGSQYGDVLVCAGGFPFKQSVTMAKLLKFLERQ